MITIYKYSFAVTDKVAISIPGQIRTLKVETQTPGRGMLCLWAIVDTEPEPDNVEVVHLRIVGTGHPFPDYDDEKLHFIDTIMDGPFVWHVFQITNEQEAPDAD